MRKQLRDIQYVAAMNPTAGSFEICERCQRHFATFAIAMPSQSDLNTIFTSLFGGHLASFQPAMQELTGKIVETAIQVHDAVSSKFLPSAVRFMYNWNMRELTNISQGLCLAKGDYYIKPLMLARLFTHESHRVYADRLVSEDEKVLGQKNVDTQIQGADINDQNPAAKPPKVPVKASLYLPKSDDLDIKPNTYGRVRPSRFTLDNVRMIPGLRGATQVAVPGLRYMPVDVLTDKAEVKEKVEGMGMSGLQILKEVAQWVRAPS